MSELTVLQHSVSGWSLDEATSKMMDTEGISQGRSRRVVLVAVEEAIEFVGAAANDPSYLLGLGLQGRLVKAPQQQ